MTNDFDLDMMRTQLATLKSKLEQQEIVNDRLMRQSMRKNVSSINTRNLILCILSLLMIPYCYWIFVKMCNFSIYFWVFTALFNVACIVYTLYNTKDIINPQLTKDSMVEVHRKVARAKKLNAQWLYVGIPFIVVWLSWLVYEIYKQGGQELLEVFMWPCIAGAVIGGIFGIKVFFKTQRQYQEIMEQGGVGE